VRFRTGSVTHAGRTTLPPFPHTPAARLHFYHYRATQFVTWFYPYHFTVAATGLLRHRAPVLRVWFTPQRYHCDSHAGRSSTPKRRYLPHHRSLRTPYLPYARRRADGGWLQLHTRTLLVGGSGRLPIRTTCLLPWITRVAFTTAASSPGYGCTPVPPTDSTCSCNTPRYLVTGHSSSRTCLPFWFPTSCRTTRTHHLPGYGFCSLHTVDHTPAFPVYLPIPRCPWILVGLRPHLLPFGLPAYRLPQFYQFAVPCLCSAWFWFVPDRFVYCTLPFLHGSAPATVAALRGYTVLLPRTFPVLPGLYAHLPILRAAYLPACLLTYVDSGGSVAGFVTALLHGLPAYRHLQFSLPPSSHARCCTFGFPHYYTHFPIHTHAFTWITAFLPRFV